MMTWFCLTRANDLVRWHGRDYMVALTGYRKHWAGLWRLVLVHEDGERLTLDRRYCTDIERIREG